MLFNLGVQVYSVRDDASRDLYAVLKKIASFGYDGVEFAGLYGNKPSEVRKMLDDTGLRAISAHVGLSDFENGMARGVIENYKMLGCEYIAVPYLPEERRPGKEGFAKTLKEIAELGALCKENGITLLYHNHNFEFVKMPGGEYGLDYIYSTIPEEYLKSEIDTCWVHVSGVDPAGYILRYKGRAPVVHLKDYNGFVSQQMYDLIGQAPAEKKNTEDNKFEFRPVGRGVLDFPGILDAAKTAGTKWVIVEQDEPSLGLTRMESIKASAEYLKSL